MPRSRSGWALLWLAWGCVHHRGGFAPAGPLPDHPIMVFALGETGRPGPAARHTAARLHIALEDARKHHVTPVVLWLGDSTGTRRLRPRARPRCRPEQAAPDPIAEVLADHAPTVIFVPGATEAGCPTPPPVPADTILGPAVVRVDRHRGVQQVASCDRERCTITAAESLTTAPTTAVDLVVLDLWPWFHPDDHKGHDAALRRSLALVETLTFTRSQGPTPPSILVLHMPVEGALEHGQGALGGVEASFHGLPRELQDALAAGVFVGVIAGGEHGQYVELRLDRAVQRTAKRWMTHPVWQVVTGTSSDPNARPGAALRRSRPVRSIGYEPAMWTDHAGFATITIDADLTATAYLLARRRRRWEWVHRQVPLRPAPLNALRDAPNMTPCRDCVAIPASEQP